MKHRRAIIYLLIFSLCGFVEFSFSTAATGQPTEVNMETRLATATNQFGFDLF